MIKQIIRKLKYYFKSSDPEKVIEVILKRGIRWYDWEKLDFPKRQSYYLLIQSALKNEALRNEIEHFKADLIEEVAKTEADYNKDKQLRFTINALETLIERLESMQEPTNSVPTTDDIYEVV